MKGQGAVFRAWVMSLVDVFLYGPLTSSPATVTSKEPLVWGVASDVMEMPALGNLASTAFWEETGQEGERDAWRNKDAALLLHPRRVCCILHLQRPPPPPLTHK